MNALKRGTYWTCSNHEYVGETPCPRCTPSYGELAALWDERPWGLHIDLRMALGRSDRRDRWVEHAKTAAAIAFFLLLFIFAGSTTYPDKANAAPPLNEARWQRVAQCESGADWNYNGPSGHDGGLQFHPDTWRRVTRGRKRASKYRYAWQAPRWLQINMADVWRRRIGGNPATTAGWPNRGKRW